VPDAGILLATFDVLAYLVICHVIGTAILLVVRLNVRGLVPPSALIGCAALAIQLWAFGFAHVPWNVFTLLLPWVAVMVVLRRALRQTLQAQIKSALAALARLRGVEPLSGALIAIAALLIVVYGLNAFLHPAGGWDAIAFWYFKAKVFFVEQHVDPASAAFASIPHLLVVRNQEYPPLYPLMLASTFVVSGRVNEPLSNSVNLLALIAAVPTMYSLVRRLVGSRLGIVFVFLLVAMAIPAATRFLIDGGYFGHADYMEAIWILLTLIYLQAGESGDGAADVMAIACAAGAALTKDEGTPLLFVTLGVLIVRQAWRWRRWRERPAPRNLIIAAVCVVPVIIWHLTWSLSGSITPLMLNRHPLSLLPQLPSRAATIARYVAAMVYRNNLSALSPQASTTIAWNTYVWMALALPMSLLLLAFNRFRTGAAVGVVFGLQLLAYFTVYLFTPIDLTEHLSESADRVILQLAPSVILLLAVSIAPYLSATWRDAAGMRYADEREPAA
jgi:hypothetical protein